MNDNKFAKPCPWCGQMIVLGGEDELPEMVCTCPGAMMVQAREENTRILLESLSMLYGENCSEVEPTFRPVEEESFAMLCELTARVGRKEIGEVSFALRDGTSGKISLKGIERKKSISRKLGK